ncbi:MAG: hypothetical protein KAX49_11240 [Halanaerobiales bacterium]|nr:hypothetical protein [Halanaerobiales bacterium]
MKKILFINFPVSGHVNPQINMCKELAEKDVKLIYYTFDRYFPKFKGLDNIDLRKYPDNFVDYYNALADDPSLHKEFSAIFYVFYTLTEKIMPFILEEVNKEKPDLIICDTLAIWGKIAAQYYNVPMAFFFSSFMGDSILIKNLPSFAFDIFKSMVLYFPFTIKFMRMIKKLEKQYGKIIDKPWNMMADRGKFSIVMTSKEFHPGGNEYPDNVKFIGPAHIEDSELPKVKDTIFVSLGTIATSETFWDDCIEATKDLGYEVVISFGGAKNNKVNIKNLPDNIKIYDNLSLEEYRKVVKRSVLFISHGGFNSISDSILYKTPLLIYPFTAEQKSNGLLIQKCGCGIVYLEKKVEVKKLREKCIEIITNKSLQESLEKYSQSFLNSMGPKKVVEELNKEFNLF